MTRAPNQRHRAPAATDDSPAYGSGRGTQTIDLFAGLADKEDAKESAVRAVAGPLDAEARQALKAGDRKRAAELFDECAALYRVGGIKLKAEQYARDAAEVRTPPKTIGRRSRRSPR